MLLLCNLHRWTCYLLAVFLYLLFCIWYLLIVCCWYLLIACCCCVFWICALDITLGGQIASCSAHQSTNTLLQKLEESGDLQDWNVWIKKVWAQNTLTLKELKIWRKISSSMPCPPIRSSTPWPPNQPFSQKSILSAFRYVYNIFGEIFGSLLTRTPILDFSWTVVWPTHSQMDQASGEWTRRDELKKVRVYHQHCLPLCLAFVSAWYGLVAKVLAK